MAGKSSSHSPRSWLDSVAGLFGTSTRKASSRSRDRWRQLRLEPLENRTLLSVNVLGSISGVAYYDSTGTLTFQLDAAAQRDGHAVQGRRKRRVRQRHRRRHRDRRHPD